MLKRINNFTNFIQFLNVHIANWDYTFQFLFSHSLSLSSIFPMLLLLLLVFFYHFEQKLFTIYFMCNHSIPFTRLLKENIFNIAFKFTHSFRVILTYEYLLFPQRRNISFLMILCINRDSTDEEEVM
jgi:hypothetical protein